MLISEVKYDCPNFFFKEIVDMQPSQMVIDKKMQSLN